MKIKNPVLLVIMSLFTLCSCNNSSDNLNKNKAHTIELENCKITLDLKLSDLIDSCRLVQLETTNESILGNSLWYFYITNDYIIVDDNNGVNLFGLDGKFIDKIIKSGRGPQEISNVHSIYYYENKDLLFINDHFTNLNYILCYDLKSRSFKPPIKKCFSIQWEDFMIYNDSLIMGSPSLLDADSNPYAIFFQDFEGNFKYGLKSKRKVITSRNQEQVLQRMRFYSGDKNIHVKYTYDDTLFNLEVNQLSPFLLTKYNSPKIDPPNMVIRIGDNRSSFEKFENSSFLIFRNQTYKGSIPFNGGTKADYKRDYFLLNKSNGEYGRIKSYKDDFIGKIQTSESELMTFPSSLPNNKLYVLYSPVDLLQNSAPELTGFSKSVQTQLNLIKNNLHETDNPILLYGIPKKKLLVL